MSRLLLLALAMLLAVPAEAQVKVGVYSSRDGGELTVIGLEGRSFEFRLTGTSVDGESKTRCLMEGTANMSAGVAAFDDRASACRLSFQMDGTNVRIRQTGLCHCKSGTPFQGTYVPRG